MKVIVAGSREIFDYNLVKQEIEKCPWEITEIVQGGARGVDSCAFSYAVMNGIKVIEFSALWNEFGKYAGIERNIRMSQYGDCLLAIWDGESYGTANMINLMLELEKPTKIVIVEKSGSKKPKEDLI